MLWQASIGEAPQVAYIDVVEEQTQGYIRCKDAASAQIIADMKADGITFTAVQGEQVRRNYHLLYARRDLRSSVCSSVRR